MDYYEFLEVYFKFRVTLSMGILNMFGIYKYYLLFILEDCLGFAWMLFIPFDDNAIRFS